MSSSASGWQFCFNPVRAVPDNSLIFDFCKTGNTQGVQRLIAWSDASVRDASSKGWTPLHVSLDHQSCLLFSQIEFLWSTKIVFKAV